MKFANYKTYLFTKVSTENITKNPIVLGTRKIRPGDAIKYIGDGRKHRSYYLPDEHPLEYVGYVLQNGEIAYVLFDPYGYEGFIVSDWYYCLVYLDKDHLFITYGTHGGGRDIYPKKIEFELNPSPPVEQLTLFNSCTLQVLYVANRGS